MNLISPGVIAGSGPAALMRAQTQTKKECVHPVCHAWLLTGTEDGKWMAKSFKNYADSAQIVRLAQA